MFYSSGVSNGSSSGSTSNGVGGICSRLPFRVLLLWALAVLICYSFLSQPDIAPAVHIPRLKLVDAIVFIAMGAMSDDPMVDFSIASVRLLGRWKGAIYVVTDHPDCFKEASAVHGVIPLRVPSASSIIQIKALKPQLLKLLPESVKGALYIDVDILVTRDLSAFFRDLGSMLYTRQMEHNTLNPPNASDYFSIDPPFDFAAFLDAKGHFVGWCSGCEKWHSGVMWLRRGLGERCLSQWGSLLTSGTFSTDQEALDAAEAAGACPAAFSFPTRHLLFAKDYIGMVLTAGQTFVHLTAAGRPEDTDYFYREVVLPRFRNALHPPLNPAKLAHRKQCSRNAPLPAMNVTAVSSSSSSSSGNQRRLVSAYAAVMTANVTTSNSRSGNGGSIRSLRGN